MYRLASGTPPIDSKWVRKRLLADSASGDSDSALFRLANFRGLFSVMRRIAEISRHEPECFKYLASSNDNYPGTV
jgi:hypothetical protein